jgi:3-hydroxyacyl-CoA dehydrogenase
LCAERSPWRNVVSTSEPLADPSPVAIIGAGSIGASFALLFASAGRRVNVYDPSAEQRASVIEQVAASWRDLHDFGLAIATEADVRARIRVCESLRAASAGASYVQECAPEQVQLKREIFAELDACAPPGAVLASSSSALPVSMFAAGLPGARRCLVAHPGNPPFLLRVVELVPAGFTDARATERARQFLTSVGLAPIVVRKEVAGFVFNRLQGAVLREAYCLVRDGVASVEDIDRIVRDGLGLRWSVVGPFETVDLNTRGGIASHAAKLGPAYAAMGAERGQHDPWTPELVKSVEEQRRALLPLEQWQERVRWRDRALMAALAARRMRQEGGRN